MMRPLLAAFASLVLFAGGAAAGQAAPAPARPRTILFIGNSFTQGAHSQVRNYRSGTVTDLNGAGYGGVPALFKRFTEEAGLDWTVALETQGGQALGFHWGERRQLVDRAWDVVILQTHSMLDKDKPGDPTDLLTYTPQFAKLFAARNPAVQIQLMATWSRADKVYRPGSPWSGTPVDAMALDLRRATDGAAKLAPQLKGVLPVGEAWNRAFAAGLADPNPYNGVAFGQVDLWTYDHYHASAYGYYLEALIVFGRVTGVDPTTLGADEKAADDLGLDPKLVPLLQKIARDQLAAG